jgi:NAD-dependent dihydropyrimidine dehydrogenase PreA subunit
MVYVITERCVKDTSCVDFCPVDAIHPRKGQREFEGSAMLYINPAVCIDCGFCERACPVKAIFRDQNIPEQYRRNIEMNADWYRLPASEYLTK